MPTYVASRISGDNNSIFPDRLEIDAVNVTHYKGTIVGYRESVMARANVASVHIRSGLFFADIIIESTGGLTIIAHGFHKRDAREVFNLLS